MKKPTVENSTKRNQAFRKRNAARGIVRVEVSVPKSGVAAIKKLAAQLVASAGVK